MVVIFANLFVYLRRAYRALSGANGNSIDFSFILWTEQRVEKDNKTSCFSVIVAGTKHGFNADAVILGQGKQSDTKLF